MAITDKVKGAAAAVTDKVTGDKVCHDAHDASVFRAVSRVFAGGFHRLLPATAVVDSTMLPGRFVNLQPSKAALMANEGAHEGSAKGHLAQAQDQGKDAAKQVVGAGDAKKNQVKAGHKVQPRISLQGF